MTWERAAAEGPSDLRDRRDRQLIDDMTNGSESAFVELFRRYGPPALGLAARVTGDRSLAEEVAQEVFLATWRRAASYDGARGSVRAWLLSQIHHRAVDVVRREESERKRSRAQIEPAEAGPTPDDVVDDEWLEVRRTQVRRALDDLPREQRNVLELAYFGGMTQSQVASHIGVPLGTVKSRTITALRTLREKLAGIREP